MSKLLAISIGPVQDFIAAARRTQDLQAGSALLGEIAKAVAESVKAAGGALIFPAEIVKDGPNKILAEIPDGADPCAIAADARQAAEKHLREAWVSAKKHIPAGVLDETLAERQIKGFLEFYAAWRPIAEGEQGYKDARRDVDRLLAGRKALRDFEPPASDAGRPKSPLDPSRDCVLGRAGDLRVPDACHKSPLWLKTRETLDAVSLLKRVQGVMGREESTTPSTSEMAARAIRPEMENRAPAQIAYLDALVKKAGAGVDLGDFLFPSRLEDEDLKDRLPPDDKPHLARYRSEALEAIGRSECLPYYAILAADGDRMGALLGQVDDAASHRELSAALHNFADTAKGIVGKHQGHCVYVGGDDVLALLPVPRALDCAAALAGEFETALKRFKPDPSGEGGTLSAGLAIVHHMDPLRVSLDRARAAEKEAKKERDSLAVALHTRGGEPLTVAGKWRNGKCREEWRTWVTAFTAGGLARGFPYELRALAREFRGLPESLWKRLPAEAERILKRKKGGADREGQADAAFLGALSQAALTPESLEAAAKMLVVARFLADYAPRSEAPAHV